MGIKSFQGARKQQQNSTLDAPFKVSDYMTRDLITFKPEQSVEQVIESLIHSATYTVLLAILLEIF